MKSPYAGLRFAAVAAAFLMVAACSSTDETASATPSSSSSSTVQPGTQADLVANVGDRVFFDLDKSTLKDEGKATLTRQATWMKQYANLTFTIEGHADERGTREYNLALGGRRATAAKDFLVAAGIDASRLKTISYGKERPVCLESNEDCWAQNRRAVTVVAEGAGS
ncbi:peptidoglycan-associated lipoprotein Pal [Parvibaculum sp.]|uniref:peptidoglycan-associated lipoprotein Pal n=1 Tax=Parvibaculum sp. TaxID=2024848 RepID=UPI002CD34503|nr:peptidoglycan-associated lipoprotein Pal [Parvibaculum sp.]HUD52069.1 peptidoglycan-associated lipoprotein Pal [Parvibaculum sp.]